MRAVVVDLRTVQPLLATSLQGDPNSSVSFSYIPGSLLRGALIGRYLHGRPEESPDILDDAESRSLFFDGATRYLHAYPRYDGRRALPTPLSWFRDKGDVLDGDGTPIPLRDQTWEPEQVENVTLAPLHEHYVDVTGTTATLIGARRRVSMHTARELAMTGEGAVFRYDALDADQTFRAAVLCDRDDDAATIAALLQEGDFWMGGSRSAGYGRVEIESIVFTDGWDELGDLRAASEWNDPLADGEADSGEMVLSLLSELIARDKRGQHVTALPVDEIRDLLGLRALTPRRAHAGVTLLGGFNQKWGLPLPQIQALAVGSVFVCEWQGRLDPERVRALVARGLGERRVEGFGRIAVGWPGQETAITGVQPQPHRWGNARPNGGALDAGSMRLAGDMALRLLRRRMGEILRDQAGRLSLSPLRLSNSQFARLEIVARHALTADEGAPSERPVIELLDNLPANARGQYERTFVQPGNHRLDRQIRDWLDSPGSWIANPPAPTVAGQTREITDRLKLEYTLRLVMALAKRASKENVR